MDNKKKGNKDDDDVDNVVMRKPKNVFEPADKYSDNNRGGGGGGGGGEDQDGKKRVKWSESTDLRERLKVYRRSQLDIPLNYHHLAVEEEREREGVKVWRSSLRDGSDKEDEEDENGDRNDKRVSGSENVAVAAAADEDDVDSDEEDPDYDEELEGKLQIIKEYTTRYTLYPAYSAAVPVYKEWLAKDENTMLLSSERVAAMKIQLELYERLAQIYSEWREETEVDQVLAKTRFDAVTAVLQEISDLGSPPQSVSKVISEILADDENVQQQVDTYNTLVQELVAGLDESTEV